MLDYVVVDKQGFEPPVNEWLRAIIKLQPAAGIVVLTEKPEDQPERITKDVIFLAQDARPNEILLAIVEARSIGVHRASGSG